MAVIELYAIVCLLKAPDQCRDLAIAEFASVQDCVAGAIPAGQIWTNQNPELIIVAMRCTPKGREA
jgi:hypothetical protein